MESPIITEEEEEEALQEAALEAEYWTSLDIKTEDLTQRFRTVQDFLLIRHNYIILEKENVPISLVNNQVLQSVDTLVWNPYSFVPFRLPYLTNATLQFQTFAHLEALGTFLQQAPALVSLSLEVLENLTDPVGGEVWLQFLDSLAPIAKAEHLTALSLTLPDKHQQPSCSWRTLAVLLHKLTKFKYAGPSLAFRFITENLGYMPSLTDLSIANVPIHPTDVPYIEQFRKLTSLLHLTITFDFFQNLADSQKVEFLLNAMDCMLQNDPKWLTADLLTLQFCILGHLKISRAKNGWGIWRCFDRISKKWHKRLRLNKYIHYRKIRKILREAASPQKVLADSVFTLADQLILPFLNISPTLFTKPSSVSCVSSKKRKIA